MQTARRYLLDVNVLIALFDDQHPGSRVAQAFMQQRPPIATCPLTENGVLRIMNMPAYARLAPVGFVAVLDKLHYMHTCDDHVFWPDDISISDPSIFDFTRISGHNQITDAYLLALTVKHNGALATLDQRIGLVAVHGANTNHLHIL